MKDVMSRVLAVVSAVFVLCVWINTASGQIGISSENPRYFEYAGETIFLNGAGPWKPYSKTVVDYEYWHDQLVAHKGNASRTVVSWPANGNPDVLSPWVQDANGKFDLSTFDNTFWNRFDAVLNDATSKGIVTLLQVWDECQLEQRHDRPDRWDSNPWNPDNNTNYTSTDMPTNIPGFYDSLPTLEDRPNVLSLQTQYMDKVLEVTAPYADHVIYVLGNEYSYSGQNTSHQSGWEEWPIHWRNHIKARNSDLIVTNNLINATRSQYNQYFTDCQMDAMCMAQDSEHFDGVYSDIANDPKPLFFSKNSGSYDLDPSTDTVWTYFCKGAAGCRFHQYWGDDVLDFVIRNEYLVDVVDRVPLAQMAPFQDLIENPSGEYCLAQPGSCYVVYCSVDSDGSVTLDLTDVEGEIGYQWHNTRTGEISPYELVAGGGWVEFTAPDSSAPYALLIIPEPTSLVLLCLSCLGLLAARRRKGDRKNVGDSVGRCFC